MIVFKNMFLNRRHPSTYHVIKEATLDACKALRISPPNFIAGTVLFKYGMKYKVPKRTLFPIEKSIIKILDNMAIATQSYHTKRLNVIRRFYRIAA